MDCGGRPLGFDSSGQGMGGGYVEGPNFKSQWAGMGSVKRMLT